MNAEIAGIAGIAEHLGPGRTHQPMPRRGVYFALVSDDVEKLLNADSDERLRAVIQDDIEERWDESWLFQTDKGWAGIHRCLTDGRLAYDNRPITERR